MEKCNWQDSMAHPRTPPIGAKISYASRVIANFVPNFVAMVTGVGRGKMQLAAFDGPSPKTPYRCKNLLRKPSYSQFCPKFRCHGNQGGSGVKLNDTVRFAIPENHTYNQKLRLYLIHSQSYDLLKNCLIFPVGAIVIFCLLYTSDAADE